MKTKDLIKALHLADPSGETEVVVDGEAIYFVERLAGYYDGNYQVLIRDPLKAPFYDITGVRITRAGEKIRIHTMDYQRVLWDNPKANIELDPNLAAMDIVSYRTKIKETLSDIAVCDEEIAMEKKKKSQAVD